MVQICLRLVSTNPIETWSMTVWVSQESGIQAYQSLRQSTLIQESMDASILLAIIYLIQSKWMTATDNFKQICSTGSCWQVLSLTCIVFIFPIFLRLYAFLLYTRSQADTFGWFNVPNSRTDRPTQAYHVYLFWCATIFSGVHRENSSRSLPLKFMLPRNRNMTAENLQRWITNMTCYGAASGGLCRYASFR